jgi:hypothetical protein
MAEISDHPVLDYQPAAARYRPRAWKAILAMFLPWVFQSVLTFGAYLPSKDGNSVHGWIIGVGGLVGVGFTEAMILRSGAPRWLKVTCLLLALPVQFFCLVMVTEYVALACGAGDAI